MSQSVAWQRVLARVIIDEESRLPQRHLIAQNVANFRLPLNDGDLVPEAGIIHFHYAHPEAADWNRGLQRVIGCDETGFAGIADATYRRQAWNFVLSGGGLFNNLDYSFTAGHEEGNDTANKAPGGGSPGLRRQLKVLADFLCAFDVAKLQPDWGQAANCRAFYSSETALPPAFRCRPQSSPHFLPSPSDFPLCSRI